MSGAPQLSAMAAARAGAGYVRLSVPGAPVNHQLLPMEAVQIPLGADLAIAADELARVQSVVIGPGLGRGAFVTSAVQRFVAHTDTALVVDGDALVALGTAVCDIVRHRRAPTILTPHDGEFRALTGHAPDVDRVAAVRALAAASGAIVLLKGPTMLIADPAGNVLVAIAGDARLATAGTGDVLSGIIGALLAQGTDPLRAAGIGAHVLGAAGAACAAHGTVASDVAGALPAVLSRLRAGS
jgi:NAD(P)H-hydrate epimerase